MPDAIPEILEIIMIIAFGFSWPINLVKAYRAKTAGATSILFLCCIGFGYVAGICSKFLNPAYMAAFSQKWYVLVFYFINLFFVTANIIVYFRNRVLDKKRTAVS